MIGWLRKVFRVPSLPSAHLAPDESIKDQLAEERRKRKDEHDRTEKLAKLLNDYRRQDAALRR